MEFRWNQWNVEHIARHGVSPEQAEEVVCGAARPHPLHGEDDKWLVWGSTSGGEWLQVVFIIDEDDTVFVIHARPLTKNEKKRYRRRNK